MTKTNELSFTPIFVGGSMRTGTSLLQNVLCSAKTANDMSFECHYLTDQIINYVKWSQMSDRMLADFFGTRDGLKTYTQEIILRLLKLTHKNQYEPDFLILKHPEITPFFPVLAELIPTAKFVTSVRDPKDAVTSMLKVAEKQVAQGRSSNMVAIGRDMANLTKLFMSFYRGLQKMPKEALTRHKFLKYEDLVLKTSVVLPKLSEFTGLDLSDYDPAADWKYTRPREENVAFDTKIRGKALNDSSIGNYKNELSVEEIAAVEKTADNFMKYFNFAKVS